MLAASQPRAKPAHTTPILKPAPLLRPTCAVPIEIVLSPREKELQRADGKGQGSRRWGQRGCHRASCGGGTREAEAGGGSAWPLPQGTQAHRVVAALAQLLHQHGQLLPAVVGGVVLQAVQRQHHFSTRVQPCWPAPAGLAGSRGGRPSVLQDWVPLLQDWRAVLGDWLSLPQDWNTPAGLGPTPFPGPAGLG